MAEPLVISALSANALTWLANGRAGQAAGSLGRADHPIDGALALFEYTSAPTHIRPRNCHVYRFKRHELPRLFRKLDADGVKRTRREQALAIMGLKGMDTTDRSLVATITARVRGAELVSAASCERGVKPLAAGGG